MSMARSLAFTALHDVSPEFRCLSVKESGDVITLFLPAHASFVDRYSHGVVKMGKTDMHTYAKIWCKSYFGYES